MIDDPIRTLAREVERRVDDIVSQFSGIGSDVDVMRSEVIDTIETALRQIQQEQRERDAQIAEAEILEDEPETEGDIAYNQAVRDCAAAIRQGGPG
jgi:ribosomal 50S subunit-associated protein YjgA (DUF615 family)